MLENGPTHYLSHRWNTTDPTDQWDPACNSRVFKSKKRLVQFFQRNHPYHLDWSNLCRKQWGIWRRRWGCWERTAWMHSIAGKLSLGQRALTGTETPWSLPSTGRSCCLKIKITSISLHLQTGLCVEIAKKTPNVHCGNTEFKHQNKIKLFKTALAKLPTLSAHLQHLKCRFHYKINIFKVFRNYFM